MRDFNDFLDTGILWAINVSVFHPRGYALALHIDDEKGVVGWSLLGDGTEAWGFEDALNDEGFRKFNNFLTVRNGEGQEYLYNV